MDTNFGIGFYFLTVFRTMAKSRRRFNWRATTQPSGAMGWGGTELLSLRGCSKALFHKKAGIKNALRNT